MNSLVRSLGVALTLSIAALSAAASRAEIVFSNLTTGEVGSVLLESGTVFAMGFSTGATAAPQLAVGSIEMILFAQSGTASPVLGLFTDAGGNPGSLISLFSTAAVPTSVPTTYSFTPLTAVTLTAGTQYWAVLGTDTATPLSWVTVNDSPALQNGSDYSFVQAKRSTDGGTNWNNSIPASAAAFQVTSVPEPSTIVMACMGVASVVVLDAQRRQRRRQTSTPAAV
jgi:hypothetical protein